MMASEKPRSSTPMASSVYIPPMRLWSTLVIHSRHKYGRCPFITTQARIARMPSATRPGALIGLGGTKGMAAQVSLPSIGNPRQCSAYYARRRSRRRRQFLGDDRFVEVWIGKAINRRRVLYRGLGDLLIAALVKCLVGTCGVLRPFRKLL